MLVRLLYASKSYTPITSQIIDAILERARDKNRMSGVTGILCYSSTSFIQVLEGQREVVSALFTKIACDSRHQQVCLLHFEEIIERRFGSWGMGEVNLDQVNPSILLKYSATPKFDPFAASGKASLALFDELIATAVVTSRIS